ncbi:DUF1697 domain-containing protein [uncultured Croceitalea sp.]|uniref:DUF1697 domain-containing protein n=1 Tax=uncultured Croceitalea sp. TaxID=1798908 RepID=UPI00374EF371
MKTFVVFLRGINVGGQKKIKMADLKTSLQNSNFKNVSTYIQSGNLILNSDGETMTIIEKQIESLILKDFGFEVPVLLTTKEKLKLILEAYPFNDAEDKNKYFTLLHTAANESLVTEFNKLKFSSEDFLVTKDCVYLNCKQGAGKAKLNNNLIERKLDVVATTRNLRTMQKMIELVS